MPFTNPQITDVQSKTAAASSVAITAFATNPVLGGKIVVCTGTYLGVAASTHTAPTDNYSNTYTQIGTGQDVSNVSMTLWEAVVTTTGASFVVTCHCGAANVIGMAWALDFADLNNGDFTFSKPAAGAAATVGPSSPAPAANSIMLAFLGEVDGDTGYGWPTGWNTDGVDGFTTAMQGSHRTVERNGFFGANMHSAYKITSTVETATWLHTVTTFQALAVMASIAPPPPPPSTERCSVF